MLLPFTLSAPQMREIKVLLESESALRVKLKPVILIEPLVRFDS
jgi:hypothetical protein